MRQILMALAVFTVLGTVTQAQTLAQGSAITHLSGAMTQATWVNDMSQQSRKSSARRDWSERGAAIYKVGSDSYSSGYIGGMPGPDMKPGAAPSQQSPTSSDHYRQTGDYKFSSPNNDSRYGVNPSDNYLRKESSGPSGASNSPYGGAVYGGVPTTPSADPMIKGLSREP